MESKIDRLKGQARGHWTHILAALAPGLVPALDKAPHHIACPVHGGADGFRFFKDVNTTGGGICSTCGSMADGINVLSWITGASNKEVLVMLDEFLNGATAQPLPVVKKPRQKEVTPDNGSAERLREVWSAATTVPPLAQKMLLASYLQQRGLPRRLVGALGKIGRFHHGLPFHNGKGKYQGTYPAMICRVQNAAGKNITLHRTYLSLEGDLPAKADLDKPKKLMPLVWGERFSGCAIRLGGEPHKGVLNVAEGIETALAVMAKEGEPCWSLINATNMPAFRPPASVKHVVIWADKDRAHKLPNGKEVRPGQDAAQKLAENLASMGVKAEVHIPSAPIPSNSKSLDWLDVHCSVNALNARNQ